MPKHSRTTEPTRAPGDHGRRCACVGCHAVTVLARIGVAEIEAHLAQAAR